MISSATASLALALFSLLPLAGSAAITYRRRSTLVCKNGQIETGRCVCEPEYAGRHCEKKKHCDSFRVYRNGTCMGCLPNYKGEYCEDIICVHGTVDKYGLACICEAPFSGEFCGDLDRGDVYRFYNNRVYMMGPLGALSLIPLCCFLYGCEHFARKRHVKRIGDQLLATQNVNACSDGLKTLLHPSSV